MSDKITLTLTREHAQTVQDACELLMRMKLGQTMFPVELLLGWPGSYTDGSMTMDEYCMRRDCANDILRAFLRVTGNREGCEKDMVENMCYEVWGTIRHALWQHDHGDDGSWSVAAQPPLSESELEMPECVVEEHG